MINYFNYSQSNSALPFKPLVTGDHCWPIESAWEFNALTGWIHEIENKSN